MSDAVIIVIVVAAAVLIVFMTLAVRFPEKIRGMSKLALTRKGIEIEFAVDAASRAIRQKENRQPDATVVKEQLEAIPRRRKVLWVDDHPEHNQFETAALKALDLAIDTARTNDDAVRMAAQGDYDLVISDIGRDAPQPSQAGLELLKRLPGVAKGTTPIVFYVGRAEEAQTETGQPVVDTPSALFQEITKALRDGQQSQ